LSSFASRQLRLRVLEALEERVKQFLRREELWPLRVPRERVPGSGDDRGLGLAIKRLWLAS